MYDKEKKEQVTIELDGFVYECFFEGHKANK